MTNANQIKRNKSSKSFFALVIWKHIKGTEQKELSSRDRDPSPGGPVGAWAQHEVGIIPTHTQVGEISAVIKGTRL